MERHKIEAPEALEHEGISAATEDDRSDLAALYPEVPVDTRPILSSDEERHRLHDQDIQRQIGQIRRAFIWIGLQLVAPFILMLYTAAAYLTIQSHSKYDALLLPGLLIIGLVIVGVWIAAYHAIIRRFSLHGLSSTTYIIVSLIILALVATPLYYLVSFTTNDWVTATGMAVGISVISIFLTFLTLQLATRR